MRGIELKEKLKTSRYSMAEIAGKMGVSPQNLNSVFQSEDVKSGVLERLAKALDVPLAYFYGDSFNVSGNNNATAINNSIANASDERLLSLLMNKDEQLLMAMKQTSKAQEQMDEVLAMMKSKMLP
jgi:transcriptional regulator with XRE-family HTH domain